jgi:PAS domain-containing protein
MPSIVLVAVAVLISIGCAFVALFFLATAHGVLTHPKRRPPPLHPYLEPTVFLYDGDALIDATEPAKRLLEALPAYGSQWQTLLTYLRTVIPDVDDALASLSTVGKVRLQSEPKSGFFLVAEHLGQSVRITLCDDQSEGQTVVMDGLSLHAQEQEIASLREAMSLVAYPIWRTGPDGTMTWANQAYLELARAAFGKDLVWPLPAIFTPSEAAENHDGVRGAVIGSGAWYDIRRCKAEIGYLHYAVPAEAAAIAERSRKSFVQTLGRTFADLSTGLAVFDSERRLVTFNPALSDLTGLSGEFLSARPSLVAFLDRLHDLQMVPEPRDYSGWRQKMAAMEEDAAEGKYEDIWHLPSGQTFKLTGRPHPDGALAILIEDVTAEISVSRQFQSEIELGRVLLDSIDDAIAVFAPSGNLVLSNRAYRDLWVIDPAITASQTTIVDSVRHWQAMTKGAIAWADIVEFVDDPTSKASLQIDLKLKTGEARACLISGISGGFTCVRFSAGKKPSIDRVVHVMSSAADRMSA